MSMIKVIGGSTAETIFFRLWLLVFIWAPIPLGSNRPWAWGLLEAWVFAIAAAWAIAFAAGRVKTGEPFLRSKGMLALLAAWLLYQLIYIVPMPAGMVAALSPSAVQMHALAAALPGAGDWQTLSVDPYTSKVSWFKSLMYVTVFVMTLLIVNTRERVRSFAFTLVLMGLALSAYAVLMHLTNESFSWFGYTLGHGRRALGTFPNPNHFAGWLEMIIALGIGLLIADLRDRRAENWKQFFRHLIEWVLSPKMRLRLILCVLVIALVATRSRMGNTAFFSSLFLAGVIGIALSRHATRGTVILLVSLIAVDVFIVGSWFGVEKLAARIEQTTMQRAENNQQDSIEDRSAPARLAMDAVKDYPAFGSGPGSWYVVFPRYRNGEIASFYAEAHNDFAQFLLEDGVIGASLLAAIVLWSLASALFAQYKRRDSLMRGISFACVMGILAMLIHAGVEFNFQIPANAMLFMLILAFARISLLLERRKP